MIRVASALFLILLSLGPAAAQDTPPQKDLTNLGLEDLMKIQVTTASKSAEQVSRVPSAIFVISQDMIRRSGAQSIPEALRLAPGVDVSQVNANTWEVSIRGFSNRFADKLLVLVDGRSVYTPDFSGVFWDELDMPMDDIDRIEVLRGPGGSQWGANVVNGVINIITKRASDTVGNRLIVQVGSLNPFVGSYDHGEQVGPERFLRVFAKYSDRGPHDLPSGSQGPDSWQSAVGGFRYDAGKPENRVMVEGSAQDANQGQQTSLASVTPPYFTLQDNRFTIWNTNLVGRWDSTLPNGFSHYLQASVAVDHREVPEADLNRTTADLDYQAQLPRFGSQKLTLGVGYRLSPDDLDAGEIVSFSPEQRTQQIVSAFVHDDVSLRKNTNLLFGSRFEKDSFDHVLEFEPDAQLLYTPNDRTTWWASWNRAVRTPSRADENSSINYAAEPGPGGLPVLVHFNGNPDFRSEAVEATEAGFRTAPTESLFLDIAAFHDQYEDLRTAEPTGQVVVMTPQPYIQANFTFGNLQYGQTDGLELAAQLKPTPGWQLYLVYSYFTERLRLAAGSQDNLGLYQTDGRGGAVRNQFQIRSESKLGKGVEFDAQLYYYDAPISEMAPAYWKLDLRLATKPRNGRSWELVGQNLLRPRQLQAVDSIFTTVEGVPRDIYAGMRWQF